MTPGFKLSSSALTLFLECPRCFWLEKNKRVKRPRGIFPSLPGGMDRVIKTYFDGYRSKKKMPAELSGEDFIGVTLYPNQRQLDEWRNWRTGMEYKDTDGSALIGALDDLLVKEGLYIPFDYKTKGSPANQEDAVRYYQKQLDCYALLLEAKHLPTAGYGFLLYYSPGNVREEGSVLFNTQAIKIQTDPERALKMFRDAVALLKQPLPLRNETCEYCSWLSQANENDPPKFIVTESAQKNVKVKRKRNAVKAEEDFQLQFDDY